MLNLSTVAALEKNKLHSDGVWFVLLDIVVPELSQTIRIVRNTEDVVWNGNTYIAFPFELGNLTDDAKGSIPSLELKVSNVTKAIQYYLEQANGGTNGTVILRVVLNKNIESDIPELEEWFTVTNTKADAQWVTFTLGVKYPAGARRPLRRYIKNFCPYKYKGLECGATATQADCPKTLTGCRERNNAPRFGGDPSIPQGGVYL